MKSKNFSVVPKCVGLYRSDLGFYSSQCQRESIESAVRKNGLKLLELKDLSKVGIKNIDSLVWELDQEKADCLIVWRLDSLAPLLRSLENAVELIAKLSSLNIIFISVEDKIDSDGDAGSVLIHLHKAWVELKRNRKIENARRSSLKSKANGKKPGPPKIRDDQKIIQLRGKGLSIRQIAKETNFSPALIHQVLKKITQKIIDTDHGLPTLG